MDDFLHFCTDAVQTSTKHPHNIQKNFFIFENQDGLMLYRTVGVYSERFGPITS